CGVYTCDLHTLRLGRDPDPSKTRGFAKPARTQAIPSEKVPPDKSQKEAPVSVVADRGETFAQAIKHEENSQ
ncbi:MAG: hypothetical protein K8F25_01575, partial [Fimbriimonadaceae bacterium]|nr:hypothetical protein [Alphaproteobacteria bacterium]